MTEIIIPDLVEPIEAWRVWRFAGGRLQSMYSILPWEPREAFKAHCAMRQVMPYFAGVQRSPDARPLHDAPHDPCRCGIYASKLETQAVAMRNLETHVLGRVALWGKVIEYDKGYRAEFAYPLELWIGNAGRDWEAVQRALTNAYGVDTHWGLP